MDGKVKTVEVEQQSPLFPNKETERFAYTIFRNFDVHLYFYRHPIDISKFTYFGYLSPDKIAPDLDMSFFAADDKNADLTLEYEPNDGTFKVRGFNVLSDPKYWRSTGEILSFVDLVGAEVFITGAHLLVSFEERDKRVQPEFESLSLDIGSRKGLWLRRQELTAHTDEVSGRKIYEYRFPVTLKELSELLK